jgi:hypothetical protein
MRHCLDLFRFAVALAASILWTSGAAQAEVVKSASSFSIVAPRAAEPPPIDGTIDHSVWRTAAHVTLTWNVDFRRPASDGTDAYVLTDGAYLYVAFAARQASPVLATQQTAGKAVEGDDWVAVFLWPSGVNGFRYMFKCNAIGVCYQTSTENDDFSPIWRAAGHITSGGFVVTMRIPLDILRGDGGDQWRMQLARQVNRVGDDTPVWAYAPDMDDEGQAVYSGFLNGMRGLGAAARPRPRLAVYGLGAMAAQRAGGSTSRVGADVAIPISRTASVFGTVHPDYSNVELDQQTIAPTEFRREFQEVRPFFTQGASFYNKFSAVNDQGNLLLYTPGMPSPAGGLAIEGTQGNFGLAAFNAASPGRTDAAQTASWSSANNFYSTAIQRVTVNMPGFADRATAATLRIDNQRNASVYADYGWDAGTNVLDPTQAHWAEVGAAHHNATSFLGAALRQIGAFYNPFDGFVAHPDIYGWTASGEQDVLPHSGPILFVGLGSVIDRYRNAAGDLDQADQNVFLSVQTRSQFSFSSSWGSNFLLSPNNTAGGPVDRAARGGLFDQNGLTLGYRDQSTTPSILSYGIGRFGDGYLLSWTRIASVQVGRRGSLSLEADNTNIAMDNGDTLKQWLERGAYAYQLGPQTSFAIGLRRIVGVPPPVFDATSFVDASNVSLALHDRVGADDVYLVYGDASALRTPPQILFKWVHYFGAEKGT